VKLSRVLVTAGAGVAVVALTGCGGGHAITPGESEAAAACRGSGASAAAAATRAAAVNPSYATLAADENAVAAGEAVQVGNLSDGDAGDDAGVDALASSIDIGTVARQKVIADCVNLGLPVARQ